MGGNNGIVETEVLIVAARLKNQEIVRLLVFL
jgi:hypothetical protein